MSYSESFLIQWNTLREEMVQTMRTQIAQGGVVRFSELDRVFRSKVKRWSTKMSEEGRWMNALGNAECRQAILNAISSLSLQEVKEERAKNGGEFIAAACGVAVGGVGGYALTTKLLVSVAPAAVCGALGYGIVRQRRRQMKQQAAEAQGNAYLEQIDKAGESIAQIWRQYESDND